MDLFKATPINENYHYGMLGQFKVIIRTSDNWINISKLCTSAGIKNKEFWRWKESGIHKEMLKYYSNIYEPSSNKEYSCLDIVGNTKLKGIPKKESNIIRGSYVPQELALKIWDWVDAHKYSVKNKTGLIYIITNDIYKDYNLYKIGLTNDISKRLKGLQTASPIQMKAIFTKEFDDVETTERTIHEYYKELRKEGEWFELEDLEECIEYINSL